MTGHTFINALTRLLIFLLISFAGTAKISGERLYSVIDSSDGLSDNNIRFIIQLPDQRMVFVTTDRMNIYDGSRFATHDLFPPDKTFEVTGYNGHHRIFIDRDSLLWIKDGKKASCFDLREERHVSWPAILHDINPDDIFSDSDSCLWIRSGDILYDDAGAPAVTLAKEDGILQDIMTDNSHMYLFFDTGRVAAYEKKDHRRIYHRDAYKPDERRLYDRTSLVKQGENGFYQLRNGQRGGMFFFNTATRQWMRIMDTDYTLNTLAVPEYEKQIYITCGKGIRQYDPSSGEIRYLDAIKTSEGNVMSTAISTIYEDINGTMWIGTYNRGILFSNRDEYTSDAVTIPASIRRYPSSFIEDLHGNVYLETEGKTYRIDEGAQLTTVSGISDADRTKLGSDQTFVSADGTVYFNDGDSIIIFRKNREASPIKTLARPILSELWIQGNRIGPDCTEDENIITDRSLASTRILTLHHRQNNISLKYTVPCFADRSGIRIRYRLEGKEENYHDMTATDIDGNDALIHYNALPPGHYRLSVESYLADEPGKTARTNLDITIITPWWRTSIAYLVYILIIAAIIFATVKAYRHYARKKEDQVRREKELLDRIKNLIEQCERYENEKSMQSISDGAASALEEKDEPTPTIESSLKSTDFEFISKAVRLVEENLDTPGYSVEQLSSDLCMERTGLYKKLTTLLDQSPSLFIRNIRLKRAAELLESNTGLSIKEIAERTGFSSSSHLSKCFQEAYGCRPSEYAAGVRKST